MENVIRTEKIWNISIALFMQYLQDFPDLFQMEKLAMYEQLGKAIGYDRKTVQNYIYSKRVPKTWCSYTVEKNSFDRLMNSFADAVDQYIELYKQLPQKYPIDVEKWNLDREDCQYVVTTCCAFLNLLPLMERLGEMLSDDLFGKFACWIFLTKDWENIPLTTNAGGYLEDAKKYIIKHPRVSVKKLNEFWEEFAVVLGKILYYNNILEQLTENRIDLRKSKPYGKFPTDIP